MRRLAQPKVMASAAVAAVLSTALSLPRMHYWTNSKLPISYIVTTLLLCGFVLWAFVFAWHTEYTHRPVFTLKFKLPIFAAATLGGIVVALGLNRLVDPSLRLRSPEDYPADFNHWIASLLFSLAFLQLFFFYAPVAWLMRLFKNEKVALWGTVIFGAFVLSLKIKSLPAPLPFWLFAEYLGLRILLGFFGAWFYLRGGVLLVWWLDLLVEARHLPGYFGW